MPHTVLIADDDPSIHELLKKALEPLKVRVLEAFDGQEALERLSERPIDLLLSDVMMPGMDGLALVRTLRETGNKNFPVVVITSMDESVRETLSKHLDFSSGGGDHFVHKPFSVAQVRELFRGILERLQPFDEITAAQVLEGDLSTLSFLDVVQLLHSARLTGTLEFDEPEPGGTVFFDEGDVINARCGKAEGRKAFYRMLVWTKGNYRFVKRSSVRTERKIETETSSLVMGGLASLDEHHRLLQQIPERLEVKMEAELLRAKLSEREREVLASAMELGARDALLDASAEADLMILRDLKALADRGMIVAIE